MCRVDTVSGTAAEDTDFEPIHETRIMERFQTIQELKIKIVDDFEWEPDEIFFIKLSLDYDTPQDGIHIGEKSIAEVTIINDDCKY